MGDVLNIALVGCGGMMGSHVEHGYGLLWNAGIRSFRIVACCDIDEARASALADKVDAFQGARPEVYSSIEMLLASETSLDAVDISTLHSEHHNVAVACLQAGKHVTIEKPLAITLRAGRQIIDAAEKAGKILHVAENYRRDPQMRAIKWAIDQGLIGDLRMLFWVDVGERLWHWGWRDDVDLAGGGWSMDGGVHFADLFRYFIGPVAKVSAISTAIHPFRYSKPDTLEGPIPATVEDTTLANLTFENGVLGQWSSTNAAPGAGFSQRVIYGSSGSINLASGLASRTQTLTMQELEQKFLESISADQKQVFFPNGVTQSVAQELNEFVEAVLHGAPMETDGWEGYKAEAISLAVYESSMLDAPVLMSDVEGLKVEAYQSRLNKLHHIS